MADFSRDSHSVDIRLKGLEFVVDSALEKTKIKEIATAIVDMKGSVSCFLGEKTAAVISDAEKIEEMVPVMKLAKQFGIQVVPVDFLDAVKTTDPFPLINDMNMSTWNCIDVS